MKKKIEIIKINDVNKLSRKIKKLEEEGCWIFRGQSNLCNGNLKTSIERMFDEWGNKDCDRLEVEIALIKKFQREGHSFGITGYDYLNIPEWLSLMQHYGAPTRLLDWSHSPWVGLFFAIIDSKKKKDSTLWALNWKELDKKTKACVKCIFKRDNNIMNIDDFHTINNLGEGVIKLNSYKQDARQSVQQSTFLFPLDINSSFMKNMKATLDNKCYKKIKITSKIRPKIIQKLYRMNITHATLYPGIEGFSKSLKHLYHIESILKTEDCVKTYSELNKKFG
jgi:hypothetical protein